MRTSGIPVSSTVASAIAFGSFGSLAVASSKPFGEQRETGRAAVKRSPLVNFATPSCSAAVPSPSVISSGPCPCCVLTIPACSPAQSGHWPCILVASAASCRLLDVGRDARTDDAPATTGSIAAPVEVQQPLPATLAYSDATKIGQAAAAALWQAEAGSGGGMGERRHRLLRHRAQSGAGADAASAEGCRRFRHHRDQHRRRASLFRQHLPGGGRAARSCRSTAPEQPSHSLSAGICRRFRTISSASCCRSPTPDEVRCAIPMTCSGSAAPPARRRSSAPTGSSPRRTIPTGTPATSKAQAKFAEINSANEILGDKEKRGQFDRGEIDAEGKPRFQGFEGFRGGRAASGGLREHRPERLRRHFLRLRAAAAAAAGARTFRFSHRRRAGRPRGFGGGADDDDDILSSIFGGSADARAAAAPARRAPTSAPTSPSRWRTSPRAASRRSRCRPARRSRSRCRRASTDGQVIRLPARARPSLSGGAARRRAGDGALRAASALQGGGRGPPARPARQPRRGGARRQNPRADALRQGAGDACRRIRAAAACCA